METKKDILGKLKRTEKLTVPNEFFDNFSKNIVSEIKRDSFLEALPKSKSLKVPEGFFDNFSAKITKKANPPKKGKLIYLKTLLYSVSSIAAVVALVFILNQKNNQKAIAKDNSIENQQFDDDYLMADVSFLLTDLEKEFEDDYFLEL